MIGASLEFCCLIFWGGRGDLRMFLSFHCLSIYGRGFGDGCKRWGSAHGGGKGLDS